MDVHEDWTALESTHPLLENGMPVNSVAATATGSEDPSSAALEAARAQSSGNKGLQFEALGAIILCNIPPMPFACHSSHPTDSVRALCWYLCVLCLLHFLWFMSAGFFTYGHVGVQVSGPVGCRQGNGWEWDHPPQNTLMWTSMSKG